MSFHPDHYAARLHDGGTDYEECTEGDKVLIGCWMIADALSDIRGAIGPNDVGDIHQANIVESLLKAAEIIGQGS